MIIFSKSLIWSGWAIFSKRLPRVEVSILIGSVLVLISSGANPSAGADETGSIVGVEVLVKGVELEVSSGNIGGVEVGVSVAKAGIWMASAIKKEKTNDREIVFFIIFLFRLAKDRQVFLVSNLTRL